MNEINRDPIARLREQIAAATRMLVSQDILDYSGHVTARVPGSDHIMIQSATNSRAELAPERLLVVDLEGKVVAGDDRPPLETVLHTEIFKARPDVEAILHCHMELSITFTLMKGVELVPMRSKAARWRSGIPTHPDPDLIRTVEQGKALAETLGPHHAALIRSHGMVLTAESVPALFVDAIHFEENARQLITVLQAGQEPVPMTDAEMDSLTGPRDFHTGKLWNYYVRLGKSRGILPADWDSGL